MRKLYVVKYQRDFDRIISKNNYKKTSRLVIYFEDNNLKYDCYGISVGKKLGNAVYRNKKKRQIRSIIDEYRRENNNHKNYIIILRTGGKNSSYQELKEDFYNIMKG